MRIKANLLPIGHAPHPYESKPSDAPTRNISPLFGHLEQKGFGSPEPHIRFDVEGDTVNSTAYSPFGDASMISFGAMLNESKNYKLEKDS